MARARRRDRRRARPGRHAAGRDGATPTELTAVVSVADDGGSSGRLREATGLPAMGDIRRCLSSLADPSLRLGRDPRAPVRPASSRACLRQPAHRRAGRPHGLHARHRRGDAVGRRAGPDPSGHRDAGRARGRHRCRTRCTARWRCSDRGDIKRVALEPADAPPAPDVVDAITGADQIVLGPGSLYTSVLAALALPAIRDAVAGSAAQVVYVCNLRPQVPETEGYDVAAHVDALARPRRRARRRDLPSRCAAVRATSTSRW